MSHSTLEPTIDSLGLRHISPESKRRLAHELIESIPDDVTDEFKVELERRLADYYANPGTSLTWEEASKRLQGNRVNAKNELRS